MHRRPFQGLSMCREEGRCVREEGRCIGEEERGASSSSSSQKGDGCPRNTKDTPQERVFRVSIGSDASKALSRAFDASRKREGCAVVVAVQGWMPSKHERHAT